VIIDNLDLIGVSISKLKANPVTVVDSNTVLALAIAFQRFQSISGRRGQIAQFPGIFELEELAPGGIAEVGRGDSPALTGTIELLRLRIREALNHCSSIPLYVINVNCYYSQ